ncbi:MAG TPA: protein kinase [Thermoanaerobaculia bacterium]|nr:protein kinase [Thermoanaerobaculia bacterium]
MTLAAGVKLGPYEIVSPLGAGGMGEVYRARDTRLGRDVAIKVLPERLASDRDAAARFERESKAVAALSHPNILAIHDVGKTEDGVAYAVTELLEGSTLRDRLEGGALPFRKCVDYGVQIAEGLAAAHERGIVHRDLKPENVFVAPDGRVKILDFGLAKAAPAIDDSATASPTVSSPTDPGTVLGTVGYMAPEQVRGRAADHRSDIFSLGSVLYEMATGRRAFKGDSAIETMNSVLKEDPPEISTVRGVPPDFDRIVRHCLEKSPAERFQSARDVAFDLKHAAGDSSIRSGPARARIPVRRWVPAAALAAALMLAAAAFLLGRRNGARNAREHPPTYMPLTFRRGAVLSARFLSDGKTVVYSATLQDEPIAIYSVRSTGPESQKLDLPPAQLFSVSKSDELAIGLGFHYTYGFMSESTLARVPITGGTPRPVAERVVSADWSPDGNDFAIARMVGRQCVLEYPAGKTLYSTGGWIDGVRVSPDGDRVAFELHGSEGDSLGDVAVVTRSGRLTKVAKGFGNLRGVAWSGDGREVYWTATRSEGFYLGASSLSGRERTLLSAGAFDNLLDFRNGQALMARFDQRRETQIVTPAAAAPKDMSWLDWTWPTDVSRDGQWLLFSEQGRAVTSVGEYVTYIRRTDGSPASRLGFGFEGSFSPDGRFAAIIRENAAARGGEKPKRELTIVPTGAGRPQPVDTPGFDPEWVEWQPDGKRIVISASSATGGSLFYVRTPEDASARPIEAPPLGSTQCFAVSPDPFTIAAVAADGRIALIPVGGGPPRLVPAAPEARCVLAWDPSGRSVYYQDATALPGRIRKLDVATGRNELFRSVEPADKAGVLAVAPIRMTPDGKTIAFSFRRSLSDLIRVDGLR